MTHSASNFQPHENEPLSEATALAPDITLVATPPGNIANASDCLCDALIDASIIVAEGARRARSLATALGISPKGKFISNFDHNEDSRTGSLIRATKAGQKVIVVTDARMPVVLDPGLAVVATTHDAGVPIPCIPGPSAVTTALTLGGLGVGHFCLGDSAPRKQEARRAWLESLKTEKRACCFFESPRRLAVTLADAAGILDEERRTSVSRELTERFEEAHRAALGELAAWTEGGVRGEITVMIEGAGQQATEISTEDLVDRVKDLMADGMRLEDAAEQIVAEAGMTKHRDLYQAVLVAREENRQAIVTLRQKTPRYTVVNRVSAITDSLYNLGKNEENLRKPAF